VPLTVSTTEAVDPGPLACNVTDGALRLLLRLVELLVAVSATVPLNPFTLPNVMLVAFENPALRDRTDLAALAVKSTLVTEMVVEAMKEMLGAVPVTVMTSLPVVEVALTVRATVFVPPEGTTTLVEFSLLVKQPQPLTAFAKFTVPLKPLTLVSVMMDVLVEPAWIERDAGLAEIVNPSTSAVTFTDLAAAPVPPVTVTM